MVKQNPLTEGALRALNFLKGVEGPIIMSDINDALIAQGEAPIASGHLTALKRRGLLDSEQVEVPVTRITKVNAYVLTDAGTAHTE